MAANISAGVGGAASGAMAGNSILPGWGTAIGAGVGGLMGLFGGGGGTDPMEAANKQSVWNHPNQTGPYGESKWTQGANGQWNQDVNFNPQLQGAADSLMTQWGKNASEGYGTGDDAYKKAFDASWGTAKGAMDPIYAQRRTAMESRLLNSGSELGDQIGTTTQRNFNDQEARDYQQALYGAVGAGFNAQGQTFNQNRQSWLDPLGALGQMNGLLPQSAPTSTGNAQLAAAQENQQQGDLWGGIGDLAATFRPNSAPMPAAMPSAPFSFGGGGGDGAWRDGQYQGNPWGNQLKLAP